jgi:putative membrane protein
LGNIADNANSSAASKQVIILLLAGSVLVFSWVWPLALYANGIFIAHMVQHLLTMNVAAVLIALAVRHSNKLVVSLPAATTFQMAALWLWHTPAVFMASHHHLFLGLLMKASLFGAALFFWIAILENRTGTLWSRIFALLVTGKVFCLLGAVFVFTRRPLYPVHGNPGAWGLTAIEDQQLAGLVMVSACALTYIAAAIMLFSYWVFKEKKPMQNFVSGAAGGKPHV